MLWRHHRGDQGSLRSRQLPPLPGIQLPESNRLQTRALFLLLIMIIAGALFGVWGMILSGPIAAMLNIWLQERLRVRETMREKEDLAKETNFSPGDLSDVLDLREDVDSTLLDTIEDEKEQISKRSKSKKKKEKDKN